MYGYCCWHDRLSVTWAGAALVLVIAMLLAIVWIIVRAANLVLRVLVAHPQSKPLLAAFAFLVLALLAAVFTDWQHDWLTVAVALSVGVLLLVARGVELYHDELFQRPRTREVFVHEVLHEPWWGPV